MKPTLAIICAVLLCGCGEVRSSPTWTSDAPQSPTYAAPIEKVHDVAHAACLDYFGEVDSDDRQGRVIVNDDFAFWVGGRTITTLTVVAESPQRTRVDLESHGAFPAGFLALGGRERHIIRWLIHRMDRDLPRSDSKSSQPVGGEP